MIKKTDIYAILMLFITWLIITGRLSVVNLGLGLALSVLVVLIIQSSFTRRVAVKLLTNWFYALYYLVLLAIEVFTASYKVAYFVLTPNSSAKAGIVRLPTSVGDSDQLIKLTLLANTITLTPGTLTVDLDTTRNDLYVHWLNIQAEEPEAAQEEIVGSFERIIRRVFR